MRIEVNEDYTICLKEVYNPVVLDNETGAKLSVCMRDDGFEIVTRHNGKRQSYVVCDRVITVSGDMISG